MRDDTDRTIRPMAAIGLVRCNAQYRYEAPRQAILAAGNTATIELFDGPGVRDALTGLDEFERIWVVFEFHLNASWQPFVQPPRQEMAKVGYFATRSPHRPNRIGMSCVRLQSVDGLQLQISEHDLLDRTPVLDLKPYLPYADAFPDAAAGWVDTCIAPRYALTYGELADQQLEWIHQHTSHDLRHFLHVQLSEDPTDRRRKRITESPTPPHYVIAFRTWRVHYDINAESTTISVTRICSGYLPADLDSEDDPHQDKASHRAFNARWP